jgi:nucleotide-binding universal stress UspA family protein
MIKRILVGLDTSDHSRVARAYAFYLARRLDASVTGLHVIDIVSIEGSFVHDISGSPALEPYPDLSARMREVLTEHGKGVLNDFIAAARDAGVRADSRLEIGIVPNQICEHARSADLVIIGHRGLHERFSTGLLGSATESVARKAPRPLMVTPRQLREIGRPVLAYDGSERAARSMRAAAEICALLEVPLAVITVARDLKLGEKTLNEARSYLESYRLRTEYKLIPGHAHEGIIGFLKEYDVDLLFMGAYGHSRIREMMIGSNTEYVIRNTSCPVFLSR